MKNIGASIKQRLKNKSKALKIPFDQVLQRYGIERFLLRLSKSGHRDKFILKGGQMLLVWSEEQMRPTMDLDFMGITENSLENLKNIMLELCNQNQPDVDGVSFAPESVDAVRIKQDADYEGVRITFEGVLDKAKIHMQIDAGFDDAITPEPVTVTYPSLLDMPEPELLAYNRESLIAEKFEAMMKLGEFNSRMKDFFDVWLLLEQFPFDGDDLCAAVKATFKRRGTELKGMPVTLLPDFAGIKDKQIQWKTFLRKNGLGYAPEQYEDVTKAITAFMKPVVDSSLDGKDMKRDWKPPTGWEKKA